MKAFQFFKVDCIRCKSQLKVMLLFPAVAFIFLLASKNNELYVCEYLVFGAIIFATQPFNIEQLSESGYINMLPGTKRDRVIGRYLFAFILLVLSTLLGILEVTYYDFFNGIDSKQFIAGILIMFAVGMIFCSLQYILYYAIGKGKSQQMMAIIRMIPAFLMFFLMGYATELVVQGKLSYLIWIQTHSMELSIFLTITGIFIYIIGIEISSKIIQKKDFA